MTRPGNGRSNKFADKAERCAPLSKHLFSSNLLDPSCVRMTRRVVVLKNKSFFHCTTIACHAEVLVYPEPGEGKHLFSSLIRSFLRQDDKTCCCSANEAGYAMVCIKVTLPLLVADQQQKSKLADER